MPIRLSAGQSTAGTGALVGLVAEAAIGNAAGSGASYSKCFLCDYICHVVCHHEYYGHILLFLLFHGSL